jgi:hypothetical protein
MSMKKINPSLIFLAAIFCIALSFAQSAQAQRRDYLTEAEIELVRDAQQIDLRVMVLTKAVDRRLAVLKNQTPKEKEEWGPLPKGTPTELQLDIEKLLQKAIEDIDEVASRNKDSEFFPKAVFKLADSCQLYLPQFKTYYDAAKEEKERGAILGSIENCNSVIEASTKVQREPEKKKKKN